MRTVIKSFLIALNLAAAIQARASFNATWSFDTTSPTLPYSANSFSLTYLSSASLSATTPAGNNAATAGFGTGSSSSFALQFSPANNGHDINNSAFTLTFQVNSQSALNSFSITYSYLSTAATGSALNTWSVVGGTGFSTQTQTITQNNGWDTATVTFTGGSVSAGSMISFTDTLTGYANGTAMRFDNINVNFNAVSPVPEPMSYSLALFGLIFIGGGAGRYIIRSRRANA